MALLLDSNVLIEAERRGIRLRELPIDWDEGFNVAAITVSEVLYGLHRARTAGQRLRRQTFFDELVADVTVLPFDFEAALINARIWSELRASGSMIGAHDLIIAATAIAHDLAIVTDNVSEFSRVPGLTVIQPAW